MEMNEIAFGKEILTDIPRLVRSLRKTGVCIVKDAIDKDVVDKLNGEFEKFLEAADPWIKKVEYSYGRAVNVAKKDLALSSYTGTYTVFNDPAMEKITAEYFGEELDTNKIIYMVQDVVGSKHNANDLHFDVQRSLKFFIYLSDTTAENGAFFCVPGSNRKTAELRKKYGADMNYENRHLSRTASLGDKDAIPMEGKAGSMIIFDTDVFHKAGFVSRGERKVMRGQSEFTIAITPRAGAEKRSLIRRIIDKIKG
jgi:ectoine hydroxylase-related dioxygenase (phytanoyl-CoA dioxygenase family)